MNRLSFSLLFVALGATIGAISSLSATSTSNTVLQLLASLVLGGAGAFFVFEDKAQSGRRMSLAGKLGLLLLASFWTSFFMASKGQQWLNAPGQNYLSLPTGTQLALEEVKAHSRMLGIPATRVEAQIESALASASNPVCVTTDTRMLEVLAAIKLVAEYHEECGESVIGAIGGWDNTANEVTDLIRSHSTGYKHRHNRFLNLIVSIADYYDPASQFSMNIPLCNSESTEDGRKKIKVDVAPAISYIEQCYVDSPAALLAAYRGASSSFSGIWPEPGKPEDLIGTIETKR